MSYNEGIGVAQDHAEAARWFGKAAEQGLAQAQFNLAVCYENGEGVLKSATSAADWYHKAGLSYLAEGKRDDASLCVDRITKLGNIPNASLADELMKRLDPEGG
jgi:TPR repeat protein